jgi:hypothetical protein
MRYYMIKKLIVIVVLFCVANTVHPMEWLKSFQAPNFIQSTPGRLANSTDRSEDPDESEKYLPGSNNPESNNSDNPIEQFFQNSVRKGEELFVKTRVKGQELLVMLSPQKKVRRQSTSIELEEHPSDSNKCKSDDNADNCPPKPVVIANCQKAFPESLEHKPRILSYEKNKLIKYVGLSIIGISMSTLVYKFFGYGNPTTSRKRPWH